MTPPVRLEAGDPAPEAGVLVPLGGPSFSVEQHGGWTDIANALRNHGGWDTSADALDAIAQAALVPGPLREGDRVKVGKMIGVIEEIEDDRTGVWVDWEDRAAVSWLKVSWLPVEAVTRIEGDET